MLNTKLSDKAPSRRRLATISGEYLPSLSQYSGYRASNAPNTSIQPYGSKPFFEFGVPSYSAILRDVSKWGVNPWSVR
ncbi:hypothetical protein LP416_13295 [Polaromonas sp. P2-4]|nr:hypothetical protein LP416_13295 [Polaromonas sp. P2-4]